MSSDGSFDYTPDAGFVGSDSFEFEISDGTDSDSATFTIDVYNTAPEAYDGSDSVLHDQILYSGVSGDDMDGDSITYSLSSGTSNGTLNFSADGSFDYEPNAGFVGGDSFEFEVTDGIDTDTGTFTIDVVCETLDVSGGSGAIAEGAPVGTVVATVDAPSSGGPYTFAITDGDANGFFGINSSGEITVESQILVDADTSYSLSVEVSSLCDTAEVTVDITVGAVLIDVRRVEDGGSGLELVSVDTSASSLTSNWVAPASVEIEITLPDGANSGDYEVELWDGSIVPADGTISVSAYPGDGDPWARVVLASDPTVQVAGDSDTISWEDVGKSVNDKVQAWAGSAIESLAKEAVKSPFEAAAAEIDAQIAQLDPADPTEAGWITSLNNFRDTELPSLKDSMAQKARDIVFGAFTHNAKAKVPAGSEVLEMLNLADSVDVSSATDSSTSFSVGASLNITPEMRADLLKGKTSSLKATLSDPYSLIKDVSVSVEHYFSTEAVVSGTLTVSGITKEDLLNKATFGGRVNIAEVHVGPNTISAGVGSKYNAETGEFSDIELRIEGSR